MTTAYNLRNKMYRSGLADRSSRLDPGSAGTLIVTPVDRAVCTMTDAGTRTLETAAGLGVGTTVLCISQTDAVVVAGAVSITINDGEYVEFVVSLDSSGDKQWVVKSSTKISLVADATVVDVTGDTSAYVESIITDILDVLEDAGLITDSTTT